MIRIEFTSLMYAAAMECIFITNMRKSCWCTGFRVDSSRAGAQRSAMKGKLEISVLSLTPELR